MVYFRMYFRFFLLVVFSQSTFAIMPDGGGALPIPYHANDRAFIESALQRARSNSEKRKEAKHPRVQAIISSPLLKWPVRKSIIVTDPDVQAISNFVDQDPFEGGVLDFDCGDRTYDGHNGLDISMAPFSWYKMEHDHGIVVAAAAGTISEKVNDQPERSCTIDNSGGENNLIVIEHQDGSMSVYAHMRTGSLTAKAIGETVTVGEYLGVVGSAGLSTGPHLHFEVGTWVQDMDTFTWTPQDPFSGSCNELNVESWWEEQPGYYDPAINAIATHDQAPEYPPCPETEIPHFNNSFVAGATALFSASYRDQLKDQNSHFKVSQPNGTTFIEWDHASTDEHISASTWFWGFELPDNAPSGEWLFTVVFEGQTVEHKFYVDATPEPAPTMPELNNSYNGAWYDPSKDGEGFNILTTNTGTVIYYYGSDVDGKRLWLISGVANDVLMDGRNVTFVMYESTGGTHDSPISSARGLSVWGQLEITFDDCNNGTSVLRGIDGEKTSSIIKIVGVSGTNCVGQATTDGPLAGAWYDLAFEGEGFNLIVTPVGTVIYYYGFDQAGNRLWFISDLIVETLQAGQQVSANLHKATEGTFSVPVPSNQALSIWGTVTIQVVDCTHLTITTDTMEGLKISTTLKIAGVVGLTCVD